MRMLILRVGLCACVRACVLEVLARLRIDGCDSARCAGRNCGK